MKALKLYKILTCEAINCNRRLRGMKGFSHPGVEFIVTDGTPESWFTIHNRLRINGGTWSET